MTTDSTIAPSAHTVNPQTFLDYFTALGGGYCLTPDGKLWLGILQTGGNPHDRNIAAQIMRQITPQDAERIKEHIAARQNGEDETRTNWTRAKRRHNIALRAYEACTDETGAEQRDSLCDIENDARWEIIKMPAPNRPALLWKLEYLFQGPNGSLDPYSLALLEQTVADCRRLLGEG